MKVLPDGPTPVIWIITSPSFAHVESDYEFDQLLLNLASASSHDRGKVIDRHDFREVSQVLNIRERLILTAVAVLIFVFGGFRQSPHFDDSPGIGSRLKRPDAAHPLTASQDRPRAWVSNQHRRAMFHAGEAADGSMSAPTS